MQNQHMLAAALASRNASGAMTNGAGNNIGVHTSSSSPRISHPTANGAHLGLAAQGMIGQLQGPSQLSSGHTPTLLAIQQELMARFPNASPDQLRVMANQQLHKQVRNLSQMAHSAATGLSAHGMGGHGSGNGQGQQSMHGGNQISNHQMVGSPSMGAVSLGGQTNGMAAGTSAPNNGTPTPSSVQNVNANNNSSSPTQFHSQLQRSMAAQHAARMSGSPSLGQTQQGRPMSASRSATPQNPVNVQQQQPQGKGIPAGQQLVRTVSAQGNSGGL